MIKPKVKYLEKSTFEKCLNNNEFYKVEISDNIDYVIRIKDYEFNE